MLIAALFTIVKILNQPRYPSTNECIKKIYTIKYYLSSKKTEIQSFARK
jgi:hypothetical protein